MCDLMRRQPRRPVWATLTLAVVLHLAAITTGIASADDATTPNPQVLIQTSQGDIRLVLLPEQAPQTVANFLAYVDANAYDGTIFHRVIPDFMIQGGGFDTEYARRPTREPITNEADNGLQNTRGTIAMARTSAPHSATNQFFINVSDNAFLDHQRKTRRGWGYAVFGRVVDGMDVAEAISTVETGSAGPFARDAPLETIVIERIRRVAPSPANEPPDTATPAPADEGDGTE